MASDLGIFNVSGGTLLTYGLWTRETDKKFSMNKVRAGVYALSIGLILFGLFTTAASGFTTGKVFTAPGVLMVFV